MSDAAEYREGMAAGKRCAHLPHQKSGIAFYAVDGPKKRVQACPRGIVSFEVQRLALNRLQMFLAFGSK